jgi:phospholipid transport system substrate-binding protein
MFLPHVDARRMTQLAMGAIWLHATLEQQERLAQEFTTLVVHAYSAALASYSDQVMVVSRLRADTGDTDVPVRFEIDRPGTQPIAIGYSLEITPSGWKVYDITIDGTSLVSAFHGAFSEQVRNHGIEGLIGLLSAANRHNSRRMAPVQS